MIKFEDGILKSYKGSFKIDLIPKSNKTSRPQHKMNPKHITIHNTGNPGASAEANSNYVDNSSDYVSWHFTIGNGIVMQELPIDESSWHAGDGKSGEGNRNSIAIEIAEVDGAYETAVEFIKELMEYMKFSTDDIVPHKKWSGKNCPRNILPKWDEFLDEIRTVTNEEIQTKLKEDGFYLDEIDGKMGPNSQQALREFQFQNGLTITGTATTETIDLLFTEVIDYKALYEEAQAKLDKIGGIL